jgi:DEAD/DEAH box helicase domain-containing protein
MEHTYVFDLETKHLASEVGGWSHIDRMGLAAAILFDVEESSFIRFAEDDAPLLIEHLLDAREIIGYNVLRFDYQVLRPYGLMAGKELQAKTIDLMIHIQRELGFRLRLDNIAEATLQEQKSGDGLMSVEWYKAGEIEKVLDYCEQDVRVTHKLWEVGKIKGFVNYFDKNGNIRKIKVSW